MSDNNAGAEHGKNKRIDKRNKTISKVIRFLIFVLPRLAYWYALYVLTNAVLQIAQLVFPKTSGSETLSAPAAAPIPVGNDGTELFLAEKRRRRASASEGWDHDWALLSDALAEKTVWSFGLNREQERPGPDKPFNDSAQLTEARPEPLIEDNILVREQLSEGGEPSNEQMFSQLDDPGEHDRRAIELRLHSDISRLLAGLVPEQPSAGEEPSSEQRLNQIDDPGEHDRRAIELRLHSDILKLHAEQVIEATGMGKRGPVDPEQVLAVDPRTMWAWAEYKGRRPSLPVNGEDAQQILSSIPEGDHVEIFAAVSITEDYPDRNDNAFPQEARFAARTFHSWILPTAGGQPECISASSTHWYSSIGTSGNDEVAESHFSLPDDKHFYAYADEDSYDWFSDGVGRDILRLPDNPSAPAPPETGTTNTVAALDPASPIRLVGDWQTAEEVALWHMSGPLGFFGARLTGGVSDRGVDVGHPEAIAQVKMQAKPVGSPLIRQLRGARPHLMNHLFYSTSGYTRAATAEASETNVALFIINSDGTVRAHGARAARVVLDGHSRQGGDNAVLAGYIKSVTRRVQKAYSNYGSLDTDAWLALHEAYEDDKYQLQRAEKYLEGALESVRRHPQIGADAHKAIISHFRNADLRAAFFCRVLGLPYPGERPLSTGRKRSTAADFY